MGKYEQTHKIIGGVLYKQCKDCEEWFIVNKDNFNNVKANKDGFNERCKVCQKAHNQEYYKENREYLKRQSKEKYWKNPKADNEKCKERYRNNPEYYTAKSRRLRSSPNCKYSEKEAEWRRNNPDKLKEYNQIYSNKKHNISEKEWKSCKDYFTNEKGEHVCAYCGMSEIEHKKIYNQQLHKEHVDCNGEGNLQNCVPSCKRCNTSKRQDIMEDWYSIQNFYDEDKLNKIHKWINEDHKLYEILKNKIT